MRKRILSMLLVMVIMLPLNSLTALATYPITTETISEKVKIAVEGNGKEETEEIIQEEAEGTSIKEDKMDSKSAESSEDITIGSSIFNQSSSYFEVSNGVLLKYHGSAENVVIPGDLGITSIGNEAFWSNDLIKSVTIPEGVVSIQDGEMYGVLGRESGAFSNSVNLVKVILPNSLETIGNYTFTNCERLTDIKIPSGVTSLGVSAFSNCKNLVKIELPSGIDNIEDYLFSGCEKLLSVDIPDNITSIGYCAFYSCKSLTQIKIPSSLKNIRGGAFSGCESLIEVELPNNLEGLGFEAFSYCRSLKKVNIPTGLGAIIYGTFYNCESLESINIPDTIQSIGYYAFVNCTSLKNVTLPKNIQGIAPITFQGCTSLENVNIPEGVRGIGSGAFRGCTKLSKINIPSTVESITNNTFYGCSKLKEVKFMGNAPNISIDDIYNYDDLSAEVFAFCPEDLIVYYLSGKTGFGASGTWQGRKTEIYNESKEKINNFVTRLYEKVLGRKADESGLAYHTNTLTSKQTTGADAAKGFVFSPEVTNKKLSNTTFINMLYQAFMGRNSDASGLSYWKNMLDNGVSREFVFKGFVESTEFTNICSSYGISRGNVNLTEPRDQNVNLTMFISRCYGKALGRTAEVDGLNYYAQEILLKKVTPLQASQNFIFSPEFKNKNLSNTDYVKVLYRTFMGREFDQSGLTYHLNRMKNGTSREEILLGFAYSPEFKTIMKGFGL